MQRGGHSTNALGRWCNRFHTAHDSLTSLLDTLVGDEYDWAPDEGIATFKERFWAIVESANWLARRLEGRGITPAYAAVVSSQDVAFEDMRSRFGVAHRAIMNWFSSADAEDLCMGRGGGTGDVESAVYCFEDLMQHHLELTCYHRAGMSLLLQLIDPSKVPAQV